MAIKRFTADSWDDALRQVRAEFGDSAVILKSRSYKQGGIMGVGQKSVVEVTASNDPEVMRRHQTTADILNADEGEGESHDYSRLLQRAYQIAQAKAEEKKTDSDRAKRVDEGGVISEVSLLKDPVREAIMAGKSGASEFGRSQQSGKTGSGLFRNADGGGSDGGGGQQRIESLMHDVSELKALVAQLATERTNTGMSEATPALREFYMQLVDNDVSSDVARKVTLEVNRALTGDALDDPKRVREAGVEIISKLVPVADPVTFRKAGTHVVALIGPTGVGKTTTLSKLAANLMLKDQRSVGFITIDTYRLGATEQLRTLAGVLDVPMRVVMSPGEMKSTIRELSNLDVVFVDTAGRSHRDKMKMNELKTFLDASQPDEVHLCVSATTHPRHMISVLDHFGSLAVDKLIMTKLDEAPTFGPMLDVVMSAQKPLSYVTIGQDIPDDIEPADARRLARLILGTEYIQA